MRKPRRRRNAPTIGIVARHAGVSPMTVSRVINGKKNVSTATRKNVESAIADLGYTSNEAARNLASANQIYIAMLYSKPGAFISEFLFGGFEQARKTNAQVIIEKCDDEEDAEQVVRRLISTGIDGVVLPPPLGDSDRVLDVLEAHDIPTVVVSSGPLRDNVSAVGVDNYEAARTMTRHIISLGHRRIGFVIGHPNQYANERRLAGYRDAMREARLDVPDELEIQGHCTYRSGLAAAEHLIGLDDAPTAIFASNDDMASATVAIAHMRGLDVPGDLTVCGFDDTSIAVTIWPELTTIHQPIVDMSREAAVLLLQKIDAQRSGKNQISRHVLLDFTLIRRQSDASPRIRPRVDAVEG